MLDQFRLREKKRRAKCYLCNFFHEMTEISNFALSFAYRKRFGDYENSFIFQSELDHKMDKKLRVAEIAARTGLSASTVSRVLAGKANTSDKARRAVLECARELGVMQGLAAGRLLLNNLLVFAPQRAKVAERRSRINLTVLEDLHGEQFLKAIDIVLEAVSDHSKRFAALAREMATAESRESRRHELLTIAENCDIIAHEPPKT